MVELDVTLMRTHMLHEGLNVEGIEQALLSPLQLVRVMNAGHVRIGQIAQITATTRIGVHKADIHEENIKSHMILTYKTQWSIGDAVIAGL